MQFENSMSRVNKAFAKCKKNVKFINRPITLIAIVTLITAGSLKTV